LRNIILLFACLVFTLPLGTPSWAQDRPIAVERFGLYVVSNDLERAAVFYERLFGRPQFRVAGMVGFDISGSLYAVVDQSTFALAAVRGNTMRGYIKVTDLLATYALVVAVAPENIEIPITKEGPFRFFQIRDPDGNLVEFYAVKSAPSSSD